MVRDVMPSNRVIAESSTVAESGEQPPCCLDYSPASETPVIDQRAGDQGGAERATDA